ncbi:MAG: glycoside hydrolase family 53 protein [Phycisphaerales bacterium]
MSTAFAPLAFAQPRRVARPVWGLVGADLSAAMRYESVGAVYRDAVGVASPFHISARAGLNLARLRVWHSPAGGWCGTESTLAAARRARSAGLSVLLDLHYSDTWADPAHQTPPAAWAGLPLSTLVDRVYDYTYSTLRTLVRAGCAPAWVQIGNEITDGMLWPLGRISTAGWDGFGALVRAGVTACEDAAPAPSLCRPMIHIDRGGDNGGCRWFFDRLLARVPGVRAIGLSYYPWWHGSLASLSQNLADLAPRYGLPLMVAETAYPWTLGWADSTNNLVGLASQLLNGYPASPAGQAKFLGDVAAIVRGTTGGLGVCAWGAELIPSASIGSACENIALFNFTGVAQPGLAALAEAGLVR